MAMILTPALEDKLSLVASLTNKDMNAVLEDLIGDRLDEKLERLAAIEEGLDDIAAGRVVAHEEVMREVRARIAQIRKERS